MDGQTVRNLKPEVLKSEELEIHAIRFSQVSEFRLQIYWSGL
jgi:hypothetical protein